LKLKQDQAPHLMKASWKKS